MDGHAFGGLGGLRESCLSEGSFAGKADEKESEKEIKVGE